MKGKLVLNALAFANCREQIPLTPIPGRFMRLTTSHCKVSLFALLFFTLASCSNYEFTLNDRTVYDPTAFRRSLSFSDPALDACVMAALVEANITSAGQLRQLQCGPGEIRDLSGLKVFHRLENLGLANNLIVNISELTSMTSLKQLDLSSNDILDVSALSNLPELKLLIAEGNSQLRCESFSDLLKEGLEIRRPKHCKY